MSDLDARIEAVLKQLEHDGKAADRATDKHPENEFSSGFSCGFNAARRTIERALKAGQTND